MNQFAFILVAALLAILATGCSNNSEPSKPGATSAATPQSSADKTNATETASDKTTTNAVPPLPTNENAMKADTNEVAVIKTTYGEMVIAFWPEVAPNTVENFKKLARQGFYDGTAFHRVVDGFMIQGGDPLSKSDSPNVGTGGPGYQINAEFNSRQHVRGVISMARSANINSAGSQFFICLADAPSLNNKYTAFGKLIKGDDVLGKIGSVPVADNGMGERSRPLMRVGVESIKIVPADSVK